MSKDIVIKKYDSHNFCLYELLDEPSTVIIAGSEITFEHKRIDKFYGRLYDSIIGLFNYVNKDLNRNNIPLEFKKVKPFSDNLEEYSIYFNKNYIELKSILKL